jgi:hypothetical protein
VLDAALYELLFLVLGLVKTNHQGHAELLENGNVVIGSEATVLVSDILWPREGNKLSWHDPVEVSIFDLLIVLILLDVEGGVAVPSEFHGVFKSAEAVEYRALVGAGTHGCVTIGHELVVIRCEHLPGLVCSLSQVDDHKAAH